MERAPDGTWTLAVDLPSGTHRYVFHLASRSWFAQGDQIDVIDPLSRAVDAGGQASLATIPQDTSAQDFAWRHDQAGHPEHERLAIYELHVQDFALNGTGTFHHVQALPRIAAMGFTALELLPLSAADKMRGWGYTPQAVLLHR